MHSKIMFAVGVAALTVAAVALNAQERPKILGVSHMAVYASDPAATDHYYTHVLGARKALDPENAQGVRYFFSVNQYVEVLPLPAGAGKNRLDHIAFWVPDTEVMRKYLEAKGWHVPASVTAGKDGSRWFDVKDPEGNDIQFVQPPAHPPDIPVNPLSRHIIHVGFIVHDRALEDTFFRGVLGFRPYWYGGMTDTKAAWISQQVPNGSDWLEYMQVDPPHGQGIPAGMKKSDVGVLDHFSLGVHNIEAAYSLLWNGDRLEGQDNLPKIGRDAKWQLNLIDPDGTRAEIMELHAIDKPCCSPFTASDPTF